jgi:hypothetical protein
MQLEDVADAAAHAVRYVKEKRVRRARSVQDRDMWPMVQAFRGEDSVALVSVTSRDDMLEAARMAAQGFCADVITVAMDAWFTTALTDPRTGREWDVDGKSSYFAEYGPGGVVSECITVAAYNRAGDAAYRSLPYVVEGKRVTWEDAKDWGTRAEEAPTFGGYVHDTMLAHMQLPTTGHLHAPELNPPGMEPEQLTFHRDMATVMVLQDIPDAEVCLFVRPGTKRHQFFRQRGLAPSVLQNPREWN